MISGIFVRILKIAPVQEKNDKWQRSKCYEDRPENTRGMDRSCKKAVVSR